MILGVVHHGASKRLLIVLTPTPLALLCDTLFVLHSAFTIESHGLTRSSDGAHLHEDSAYHQARAPLPR